MKVYFDILRFNFLQFIHYPLEIFASGLTQLLTVLFLMIFWSLVLTETNSLDQLDYLLGYFLISGGIGSITMVERMKLGSVLRKGIKSGSITNNLLKPYHSLLAIYVGVIGDRSITLIPAIFMIIAGVWIIKPAEPISLILFIFFLVISISLGFAINLLQGILTFHVTEPTGLMSALGHITRLLSGAFIPLNYFPEQIGIILGYLPFSMMIYTPITMLTVNKFDQEVLVTCAIGIFWAILLNLLGYIFWKKGLKKYEAVGL